MKFKIIFSLFLCFVFMILSTVPVFAEEISSSDVSQTESQELNQTVDELYYLERIYILLFIIAGFSVAGIFVSRPRRWI